VNKTKGYGVRSVPQLVGWELEVISHSHFGCKWIFLPLSASACIAIAGSYFCLGILAAGKNLISLKTVYETASGQFFAF
jgi:hypothetical protein